MDPRAAKARDFLEEVLRLMGAEAQVAVQETEDFVLLSVEGEDTALLIGPRGRTLNALQDVVSLAANRGEEEWRKILVDIGGYRDQRRRTLEERAQALAERAVGESMPMAMEPMNAFERRIVHLALADNPSVETTSEGEEPFRRVVIAAKKQDKLMPSD